MAAKESIGKTVGVVVAVCLVCSIIVSGSAIGLRDKQQENARLDVRTNILDAAGVLSKAEGQISTYFDDNIETKYLELKTGQFVDMPVGYTTIEAAARDPETSHKPEDDFAKLLRQPNVVPVYFAKDDNGKLDTIVVPVYGAGLWGMMRAFLAVDVDGVTTKNLVYYEHLETPGLGAEVLNPKWKALWDGKKLYDENGDAAIKIVKGGAQPGDVFGVDALSGATLTSNGVQSTLDYWLGNNGYQAFFANKPWKS